MKHFLFSIIFFVIGMVASAQTSNVLMNADSLAKLCSNYDNNDRKEFIKLAEQALTDGIVDVCSKEKTLSGNKHNYESLQRYSWRDDTKNDGSYTVRDGVLNPEINNYDFPRLIKLRKNLQYSALAFYLTSDKRFHSYFVKQLDAWFIDNKTRMAPNFEYAQIIPGRNNGRGQYYGMIEAYEFCDIIDAVRSMDLKRSLGKMRIKKLKTWFSDFSSWYKQSANSQSLDSLNNNIAVATDILLYDIYSFCGKNDEAQAIVDAFVEKRVNAQIEEDGTMPAELRRTKAFSYSIYNLQFFLSFAEKLNRDGQNLLQMTSRISKAIDFLSQYLGHRDLFTYQEIGDWNQQERLLRREQQRAQQLMQEPLK